MRPAERPKRRQRLRSRAPKGLSGAQVASALDLLANQTASDLSNADFSAFKCKLSWQELAQGVIESIARSLLELEDVLETYGRAQLLWQRLESRRDAGVRTTNETRDAIELLRRTTGCPSPPSATALKWATFRPPFDAHLACWGFGSAYRASPHTSHHALPPSTASCAPRWRPLSFA